jgi:hypothetical protein
MSVLRRGFILLNEFQLSLKYYIIGNNRLHNGNLQNLVTALP